MKILALERPVAGVADAARRRAVEGGGARPARMEE